MYFVTTKSLAQTVVGKTPMSAADALAFVRRAAGTSLVITVRDERGNPVTVEQLEREAETGSPPKR